MTLVECPDIVPGCEDCLLEAPYRRGPEHECDDVCRVFGKMKRDSEQFHAITHQPEVCDECAGLLDDHLGNVRLVQGYCETGCCAVWSCPDCNAEQTSAGPIDCPTCSR